MVVGIIYPGLDENELGRVFVVVVFLALFGAALKPIFLLLPAELLILLPKFYAGLELRSRDGIYFFV
jgi:uncharacterized membrane protein YvlD (DUF360 family)